MAKTETPGDNPFAATSGRSSMGVPRELEDRLLNRACLTSLKVLGAGHFGQVHLADQRPERSSALADGPAASPVARAVKVLRGGASAQNKEAFLREACIQASLSHPVRTTLPSLSR